MIALDIIPFAVWMALMMLLPSDPWAYALRTVATTAVMLALFCRDRRKVAEWFSGPLAGRFFWGIAVGLAVFVIWVLPEQFDWAWYREWCIIGEGGTKAIAESDPYLIALRLIGSAFVISVAEELFFRRWLMGFAGFWWMLGLFAIEHDRYLVGAIAGALYAAIYLRKGLFSAIVAHAVTNLVLGIWVLKTGQWQFW